MDEQTRERLVEEVLSVESRSKVMAQCRYFLSKQPNVDTVAEDVTQEVLLKAVRSIEKFRGGCKLSTWLCRIAFNQSMDHLRKIRRSIESSCVSLEHEVNRADGNNQEAIIPFEAFATNHTETLYENRDILRKLYKGLDDKDDRELFIMMCLEWSGKEISNKLQLPLDTAKSRIFRLRSALLKEIQNASKTKSLEAFFLNKTAAVFCCRADGSRVVLPQIDMLFSFFFLVFPMTA